MSGDPYRTPAEMPPPLPVPGPGRPRVDPPSYPPQPAIGFQAMTRQEAKKLLDEKIDAARAFARKVRSGPSTVRVRSEDLATLHDVIAELAELGKQLAG